MLNAGYRDALKTGRLPSPRYIASEVLGRTDGYYTQIWRTIEDYQLDLWLHIGQKVIDEVPDEDLMSHMRLILGHPSTHVIRYQLRMYRAQHGGESFLDRLIEHFGGQ